MSTINITVLGSGSNGNCTYIETPQTRFLIDAGFSGRQIQQRLQRIGRTLDDIQAVLLTHEHSDHTAGLSVLAKKQIPVYTNCLTANCLRAKLPDFKNWNLFQTGGGFSLGDSHIRTFSVPHDAYDPVGYTIAVQNETIGFLTDLGYASKLVLERAKDCPVLVLEANHDIELLKADTKRPWAVKQRILARHGHLSNDSAAEIVGSIISDKLRHIFLGHLSEDCNRPELARCAIQRKLDELNITHLSIYDTFQNELSSSLQLACG